MAMTPLQGSSPVSSAQRPHACWVFCDMTEQLTWLYAAGPVGHLWRAKRAQGMGFCRQRDPHCLHPEG